MARAAIVKALKAVTQFKPEDLTASDMIRLLKMGLEQERRALGIPKLRPPEHRSLVKTSSANVGHQIGDKQRHNICTRTAATVFR